MPAAPLSYDVSLEPADPMVRSRLVTPLITVVMISMLLLPACSHRLPTAPGGDLSVSLLLRFPEASGPEVGSPRATSGVPVRSAATARLDTVRVAIFERIAGRDSSLIASEILPLTPGQSSFAIRIQVRFVDSYAIRAEVTGTRQRPGRNSSTLQGVQFVGYTITNPASLQTGALTLDLRDAVPLPRLFRVAGIDSLGWDAVAWPAQYVVRDTLGVIGRTTQTGLRVGRLSTGYRIRAELALGADSVIGAFSEALDIASPPSLSQLRPDVAPAGGEGFSLVVEGTDFLPGAVIRWDGEELPTVHTSSSVLRTDISSIRIAQPDTVEVRVRNPDGQQSYPLSFQIRFRPPIVTSVNPDTLITGGEGTSITIAGSDFKDGATVMWNGFGLLTRYAGPGSLVADVSAGRLTQSGEVLIRVRNPDLQESNSATLIVRARAPVVTSVRPDTLIAGSEGTSITVAGSDFQNGAEVMWDGLDLQTQYADAGTLVADVPAERLAQPDAVAIRVQNPDLQQSNNVTLLVRARAPVVTSVRPDTLIADGEGTSITVTGWNFADGAVVRWDDAALVTQFQSASELTATVPASHIDVPGTVRIAAQNPDAQLSGSVDLVVRAQAPVVNSVSPDTLDSGGGNTLLTLLGSGFDAQSVATWNDVDLVTSFISAGEVRATVPGARLAQPGSSIVRVRNTDGQTSNTWTVVVRLPAPELLALDPGSMVTIGRGYEGPPIVDLNLSGAHFRPRAVAYWGTHPLVTTYTSSSALLAAIPIDSLRCSGTMPITVVNPDDRASDDLSFEILYGRPWIASLTPASTYVGGPAFELRLDGCDFQPGARVTWSAPDAYAGQLEVTWASSTRIFAQVPAEALYSSGYSYVYVHNPDEQETWASFYVNPGGALTPSLPSSALTPDGKPQPRRNPPVTLRRDQRGVAPNGSRLAPAQTPGSSSP
jgi:hypothetical protein